LLSVLNEHAVEYFIVGALAAVLQGAPVVTFDVDIVHRRSPENVTRLLTAHYFSNGFSSGAARV
jgi:hypothetical protein